MAEDQDDRLALSDRMEQRRLALGLTWGEIATRSKLSREGVRAVRHGTSPIRPLTKAMLERALRWKAGSIDAILAGGEPTDLAAADLQYPDESVGIEVDTAAHVARKPPRGAEDFVDVGKLSDEQLAALLADLAAENARRRATE